MTQQEKQALLEELSDMTFRVRTFVEEEFGPLVRDANITTDERDELERAYVQGLIDYLKLYSPGDITIGFTRQEVEYLSEMAHDAWKDTDDKVWESIDTKLQVGLRS